MYENWFPFNIHTSSYLDLFPKEKLIYLTPHCREEMLEYDHNAIYIIGGIVDKVLICLSVDFMHAIIVVYLFVH